MVRYAKKVDANHGLIRDGLRQCGYVVLDTSGIGNGVPDLCVLVDAVKQRSVWLEIKDGDKVPSAQKLKPAEEEWFKYNGHNSRVVNSFDAALNAVQEFKREECSQK